MGPQNCIRICQLVLVHVQEAPRCEASIRGPNYTPGGAGRELAERGVQAQFLWPTRQSLKGGGWRGKMLPCGH